MSSTYASPITEVFHKKSPRIRNFSSIRDRDFLHLAAPPANQEQPLASDWRSRARPIKPGGTYPAKDHCSQCGLCDTYYVAHVKEACAFLGDGMARVEVPSHHIPRIPVFPQNLPFKSVMCARKWSPGSTAVAETL